MAKTIKAQAKDLKRLQKLLDQIAKRHPKAQSIMAEAHALLHRIVPESAVSNATPKKRAGIGVRYEVRQFGSSSALYELRRRGTPLRVGKVVFREVTEALANTPRPLQVDEIAEEMPKSLRASNWQIRVVLRFMQRAQSPLLHRSRSRYAALESKNFREEAERYWQTQSSI